MRLHNTAIAMAILAGTPGLASAELLGIVPAYPQITYGNPGVLNFNPGSLVLAVDGNPVQLQLTAADTDPFPFVDPKSLRIRIRINGACAVTDGDPAGGADLEVTGTIVDPFPPFLPIKSGVLLTGVAAAMGSSSATATTSAFDFRFTSAGGLLVTDGSWPTGMDIGVVLTSENSTFAGDCTVAFSGQSKGVIGPIEPPQPPSGTPVATLGYWKNHLSDWPVTSITVGGVTRTAAVANSLMSRPPKSDKTWSMYQQLTAATLNVASGSDSSCIAQTIAEANAWLVTYPLGSGVGAGTAAWREAGDALHEMLDAYNNGELCAPHRDS